MKKETIKHIQIAWIMLILPITTIFLVSPYDQMKLQAKELKGLNINESITNIMEYVYMNTDYEFHYKVLDVKQVWRTKKADCTDRSTLIKYMLESIYGMNLNLKYAHGYCDKQKHDWLVYNKTIIDLSECEERKFYGYGVW